MGERKSREKEGRGERAGIKRGKRREGIPEGQKERCKKEEKLGIGKDGRREREEEWGGGQKGKGGCDRKGEGAR